MPYMSCPACALTTYSAATFATLDECPRCAATIGSPVSARRSEASGHVAPVALTGGRALALAPAHS